MRCALSGNLFTCGSLAGECCRQQKRKGNCMPDSKKGIAYSALMIAFSAAVYALLIVQSKSSN